MIYTISFSLMDEGEELRKKLEKGLNNVWKDIHDKGKQRIRGNGRKETCQRTGLSEVN